LSDQTPTIALVAGEASGDQLGAALVSQLRARYPQARFVGVAGPRMQAAGVEAWWDAEELALFGLFEVLSHLPRLVKLRRELKRRLLGLKPDVFIGIDAPDFNLGLEIKLRRHGIRTIHYVSPTVWAWREKRVRKIARAADLVLCLFPFEPDFYGGHGVKATYVGHPLADQITPDFDKAAARGRLSLSPERTTIALLPGSRASEVSRLAEPMIEAARLLSAQRAEPLQFVTAMANKRVLEIFRSESKRLGFSGIEPVLHDPRTVIAAADAVMCASGTATLEVTLVNRPLVSTYIVNPATWRLVKYTGLIKPQFFALPNILAGEELIPERVQEQATAENIAHEINRWLDDRDARDSLRQRFSILHEQLRCDASARAAKAVSKLLESRHES
jgi:lipid-A-disaccharide synthase